MVQTITIFFDETFQINTGINFIDETNLPFTDEVDAKISVLQSAVAALGASQVHAEKDTFRQFEHVIIGGEVSGAAFGNTISSDDFAWIIQSVDEEIAARKAAAEAEEAAAQGGA